MLIPILFVHCYINTKILGDNGDDGKLKFFVAACNCNRGIYDTNFWEYHSSLEDGFLLSVEKWARRCSRKHFDTLGHITLTCILVGLKLNTDTFESINSDSTNEIILDHLPWMFAAYNNKTEWIKKCRCDHVKCWRCYESISELKEDREVALVNSVTEFFSFRKIKKEKKDKDLTYLFDYLEVCDKCFVIMNEEYNRAIQAPMRNTVDRPLSDLSDEASISDITIKSVSSRSLSDPSYGSFDINDLQEGRSTDSKIYKDLEIGDLNFLLQRMLGGNYPMRQTTEAPTIDNIRAVLDGIIPGEYTVTEFNDGDSKVRAKNEEDIEFHLMKCTMNCMTRSEVEIIKKNKKYKVPEDVPFVENNICPKSKWVERIFIEITPPGHLCSDSYRDNVDKIPKLLYRRIHKLVGLCAQGRYMINYGIFRQMKSLFSITMNYNNHMIMLRKNPVNPRHCLEPTKEVLLQTRTAKPTADAMILDNKIKTNSGARRKNPKRKLNSKKKADPIENSKKKHNDSHCSSTEEEKMKEILSSIEKKNHFSMDRASFECIIMNSNIENNSVLISSSKSDDEVDADIDLDKGNGILNEEHLESIDTKLKREDCVEFKYWVKCIPYHRNSIRRIYNRINQTMHEEYLCHHECENLCKEEAFFYDYMPRIITQREWNLLQDENSWWNDELINFSYTWFSRYADRDKSSFLFLPSFWSAYTESETVGAITGRLNKYLNRRNTTIQRKTMIALPHNVGKNHWRLFLLTNPLYVKTEDKSHLAQIFLFDSFMRPGDES